MTPVIIEEGSSPVILAQPHSGTFVPPDVWLKLNAAGRKLADTDWFIDRLYEDILPEATIVRATFNRYVIDANRPPDNESLYPGQNTTGLCPTSDFTGAPIYREGEEPTEKDIQARLKAWHAPYHKAITDQILRLKGRHRQVLLYDCHSIAPYLPHLFDGHLPDFNIGTYEGQSCRADVEAIAARICGAATDFTHVVNGRFKGGWTTRHYGDPLHGVHAFQMELSQSTYMMNGPEPRYDDKKASKVREILADLLYELGRAMTSTPTSTEHIR